MKNDTHKLVLLAVLVFVSYFSFSQQTIILQPGPSEGKDARVWSLSPNSNFWDYPYIKANAWTWSGVFGIERTFIEFDIDSIPPDVEITSAKLSFFYHYFEVPIEQTNYGDNSGLIQRVITPWSEAGVTWDNQPTATGENQVIVPPTTDPQQDYTDIDVTNIVIDMYNDPENSYGFFFRIFNEEQYRRLAFASSDHPDSEKWPMLVITYECDLPIANFSFIVENGFVQFTDLSLNATSWNWDFGDGYSSTLKNPVHQYYSSGPHIVCLTVENDCGTDMICDTVRPVITSLSSNKIMGKINIFPNPTNGLTKISFGQQNFEYLNLYISDIQGRVIFTDRKNFNSDSYIMVDFSGFNQGIYFVRLVSDTINEIKKIIVK